MEDSKMLIKKLSSTLIEMINSLNTINNAEVDKLQEKLSLIFRHLTLSDAMGDKQVFVIAGAQGVGKTTLLSSLYQLEGEAKKWLQPNEGRGETLPIMILEKDCDEPEGAVLALEAEEKEYEKLYSIQELPLEIEKFHQAARNPEINYFLPILYMPRKYFEQGNQAWLLLPGYESINDKNENWQKLMRQALVNANNCIVVTTQISLKDPIQSEAITRDMLKNDLAHAQKIIAITNTETLSQDDKYELEKLAKESFGIKEERNNSFVICTGSGSKSYVEKWLPPLEEKIKDFFFSGGQNRKKHFDHLQSLLKRELNEALRHAEEISKSYFFNKKHGSDHADLKMYMNVYDESVEQTRDCYIETVDRLLNDRLGFAQKKLDDNLIPLEGIRGNVKKFFKTHSERRIEFVKIIKDAWMEPEVKPEDTNIIPIISVFQMAVKNLNIKLVKEEMRGNEGDKYPITLPEYNRPNEDETNSIIAIFSKEKGLPKLTHLKEIESGIKLIPNILLEYALLASYVPDFLGVKNGHHLKNNLPDEVVVSQAYEKISEGIEKGGNMLKGLAAIIGLDLAEDGRLNLFNLFSPKKNNDDKDNVNNSQQRILAFTTSAVAIIAVADVLSRVLNAIKFHDATIQRMAYDNLENFKTQYKNHFIEHFDSIMKKGEYRLRDCLRNRLGLSDDLMHFDRISVAIANAKKIRYELLDGLKICQNL